MMMTSTPPPTAAAARLCDRPQRSIRRRASLSSKRRLSLFPTSSSSTAAATAAALFLLASLPTLADARQKLLIYTRTEGYRHLSIPTAIANVKELCNQNGVDVYATEDESKMEDKSWLYGFDALVFISTSGDALTGKGISNMRNYIQDGGGFFSAHEACDALLTTPWYLRLVGAQFDYHPEICHATLNVHNEDHPSVAHLNSTWKVFDEMYNFLSDPRKLGYQLVLSADDHSYHDPVNPIPERIRLQGNPHPIAWFKEGNLLTHPAHKKIGGGVDNNKNAIRKGTQGVGGAGRSFYTALGHTDEQWEDETFHKHVWGAISWVLDSPSIQSNSGNTSAPGTAYTGTPHSSSKGSSSSNGGAGSGDANSGGAPTEVAGAASPRAAAGTLALLIAAASAAVLAIAF
ncbi:class I glutamine amidotransferase-like protein [Tilletiaria anomala UBC 951]|uniref:Class I glutamine amidotransferase-like protein n=1 Tax=Tilletiaria anomala (strain ATCC 24038 / CBS 436.72 / UBC 951) TaxID=1037660 RepID=A0A066VTZ7_TILAU|nr:class I glutamine amidotransferase-like protein [Tilletiaria anomala UBC 951]KDN44936.1 class I glutamine amidotransferase-like protein [Tilletiaria anomala UBC 951]